MVETRCLLAKVSVFRPICNAKLHLSHLKLFLKSLHRMCLLTVAGCIKCLDQSNKLVINFVYLFDISYIKTDNHLA